MIKRQRGVSLMGLMMGCVVLVLVAVLGMKVAPSYIEYSSIKKAVTGISGEMRSATVADVRKAFDKRAQVDSIEVITGADLEVSKDGSDIVISFSYPKKIPLFGNVSILIDYAGSSGAGGAK
ncbi:MAG: DUF4845 domain-containing protein [Proteobacteria bacterium]|nr:DUF4845 domain-containing protein [Pseudomonadota bacterium]